MGFMRRLRGTIGGSSLAANVQAELEFHIEQRIEELVAEGRSASEARRIARGEFGNSARLIEETRDADIFVSLENWLRDARQSFRGLCQRPVFAITAIASLAIGIGAVTSLFSIADAVVFKPVALPGEERLHILEELKRGVRTGSNGPRLKDWQTLTTAHAVTGSYSESVAWRGPDSNESVRCLRTYSGFMATAQPAIAVGRGFTKEEESGERVALVTYAFWQHRLNSQSPLNDRTVELGGIGYRLVGVLDAAVGFPDDVDLWTPAPAGLQNGTREASYLDILVRLKPGVTISQTLSEAVLVAGWLGQAYPKTDTNLSVSLAPLRERISREARPSLFALLSVGACILAMICVNIAALLLSRGTERERESALRSALGATPGSLIGLYMIEALILACAGGSLGVLFACTAVDVLKRILPGELPRLSLSQVDSRVFIFAMVASMLAALTAGLAPAWLASRKTSLHESARGASARADRKRLRTVFVIVEIALSVLLVTTGLRLGQAFLERSMRPNAFQVDKVVAVTIPFSWTTSEDRIRTFSARALERFRTLPGTTNAGLVDQFPLLGGTQDREVRVEGISTGAPIRAGLRLASPEYFDVMNVRLLEGRMFGTRTQTEYVANSAFAKRYLTDGAHRVAFGKIDKWYEIVGVIGDIPQNAEHAEADPELFTFYANDYWVYLNFALRTSAPVSVLAPLIRQEVTKLDHTVIVKSVVSMKEKIGESAEGSRVRSTLVGSAAALALLLMAIGIHGLIAGDVATRWREFGIRLALGASVQSIRGMLIQKISELAAVGVVGGIVCVFLTANLLAASFENLPPVRLLTILSVCAVIGLAALTAILWPLHRIARIDPSSALRHE